MDRIRDRSSDFRTSSAWALSLALIASLGGAIGCDAELPEEAAADSVVESEPIAQVASSLDLSNYQTAGQVLCDLMNQIPAGNLIGVSIAKPWCRYYNYNNLYYLGSFRRSLVQGPTPASQRAIAMSDALFCALKEADGATADGTISTAVGRFGMSSRIEVPKVDPASRQLVGQRVGTLWAFGVPLDIDNQDFVVSFPTEQTPSTTLGRWIGYYMNLRSSTTSWGLGGSGQVGLFNLALNLGQDGYFRSLNNNGIAFASPSNVGGSDSSNGANPKFLWDSVYAGCDPCRASGAFFCTCPSSGDLTQHNAFAGWTDDMYRNLGDGKLPYAGPTGGVSGKYVYQDPSLNWTQLGFTSGGVTSEDPNNSGRPSTHLDFTVKLDYAIISLGVKLGVGFRSGMELSQGSYFRNEFREHFATVKTSLEASSNAFLNVRLVIANPFRPFGPDNLLDENFDIFNETRFNGPTEASRMEYDFAQGFPFSAYVASAAHGSASSNPQGSHDACVAVPPVDRPLSPPGSPQDFLNNVKDAAQEQLFPCHVRMCSLESHGAYRGHVRTCEWNRTTKQLDCVQTQQDCTTCLEQSADLCSASGQVYHPTQVTRPGLPCQIN